VVVGVSGGADSICLLHALRQCAAALQLTLHVGHLDHGLRPESGEDAAFVVQLALEWGLPIHTVRLASGALTGTGEGVEAAARRARYGFLGEVAHRVGGADAPALVAVAHHQEDQAETVLINFLRGSGPAGLAGMGWTAALPGSDQVRLVRPLLGASRAEVRGYLAAYGLTWREDASNLDSGYLRNRVRHLLLPSLKSVNPALVETLARTADLFAAEAARGEQIDQAALAATRLETDDAEPVMRVVLDLERFARLDLATQRGVLRLALAELGADLRDVGLAGIDRLLDGVANAIRGGPHPLHGNLVWTVVGEHLSLHRQDALPVQPDHPHLAGAERLPLPIPLDGELVAAGWRLHSAVCAVGELPSGWRSKNQPWAAVLDAERAQTLWLTTPERLNRPGAVIAPLGLAGHHKTLGDLFTDHKTPVALRPGWPLVVDETGQVVWVCGLTVGHGARITAATRQVRALAWRRCGDGPDA
jgi:tRNA(Ile)-lysidine synthase